jgi:hypothetical protein
LVQVIGGLVQAVVCGIGQVATLLLELTDDFIGISIDLLSRCLRVFLDIRGE